MDSAQHPISTHSHHDLIAALAAELERQIMPLADPREGFALLDFPNYSNVGDSLIWLGELSFFDRMAGRRAGYVCTTYDFSSEELNARQPDGPVYLSGGGNFGDIWPRFLKFRLQVLEQLKGRKVIQLPQTLHFRDEENIELFRRAIGEHGDFALTVRDRPSFEFAQKNFDCEVRLAPDAAFAIGPVEPPQPQYDIVALRRTDQEAADTRGELTGDAQMVVTDWILDGGPPPSFAQRAVAAVKRRLDTAPAEERYRRTAMSEMQRGKAILGQGRVVVTDRLHGHIFSCLLGLPNFIVDNNYGKIGGVMDCWTGGWSKTTRVSSFAEAVALAKQELAGA